MARIRTALDTVLLWQPVDNLIGSAVRHTAPGVVPRIVERPGGAVVASDSRGGGSRCVFTLRKRRGVAYTTPLKRTLVLDWNPGRSACSDRVNERSF